jgi:hypothetical protein
VDELKVCLGVWGGEYGGGGVFSSIASGCNNAIESCHSFIASSSCGCIDNTSDNSFIGTGANHCIISGSCYSTIGNGCFGQITNGSCFSTISNGYQVAMVGGAVYYGTISNGYNNCVSASNYYVTIGNGKSNEIARASTHSSILNGKLGFVRDAEYATILNGVCNTICNANYGTSSGYYTLNSRFAQRVHGNSSFTATQGDGQHFELVAYQQLADDTPTAMTLQLGAVTPISTRANTAISVNIKTLGTTSNDRQISDDVFAVFRTDGSNNVTMSHCERYASFLGSGFGSNDITVQAGTNSIEIQVTGQVGVTTNFISYISGIEFIKPT